MLENHPAHGLSARLGDFGISRSRKPDALTMTHINTQSAGQGTPLYLAPECGRGDYSNKSDVYAYAMVILETLTGLPLENPTPVCLDRGLLETEVCSNLHVLWENRLEDEVEAPRRLTCCMPSCKRASSLGTTGAKASSRLSDDSRLCACLSRTNPLQRAPTTSITPLPFFLPSVPRASSSRTRSARRTGLLSHPRTSLVSSRRPPPTTALLRPDLRPRHASPPSLPADLSRRARQADLQRRADAHHDHQRARAASDRVLQAATRAADH